MLVEVKSACKSFVLLLEELKGMMKEVGKYYFFQNANYSFLSIET